MKRYIKITLIILACLSLQGCSHFDDMNKNPYGAHEVSSASFIQTITFNTQSKILSTSYSLTSQLMQHAVSVSTSETSVLVHNYDCSVSHTTTFWDLYLQKGNAESMIVEARKDNDPGLEAIAMVLRTYVMQIITDVYGDVPYFQAGLMPVEPTNVETNLKYDSQKEIYKDMLLTLEKANKLFKEASNFNNALDNTYGGNVANWRKLGNTLYLRLLMRASLKTIEEDGGVIDLGDEYGAFDVRNKIAEIYDGYVNNNGNYPIFQAVDDRALVHYNTMNAAYYTPFYNTTNTLFKQYAACETIVNEMVTTDEAGKKVIDPRYYYYFSALGGLPTQRYAYEVDEYLENHTVGYFAYGSTYGNLKQGTSYGFMNYSEPLFIFAEACCREWIPGGTPLTRELYLKACEASMMEWNPQDYSPSAVLSREDYIAYLDADFIASGNVLETILTQKWIASFWYGVEAWSDYRRTGYPILKTNGPAALNNKILCTRMMYPYTEPYQNGKCYQEAVNGWLGGTDNMQTDMWFADTQESKSIRRKGRQ